MPSGEARGEHDQLGREGLMEKAVVQMEVVILEGDLG